MNKRTRSIITILTVICAVIAIISAFSGPIISLYISGEFNIDAKDAASVGIIGGADGPTAIYLTGHSSLNWFAVIFTGLTLLGIIVLVLARHKKTQD